jgi:glycine C-acetyltransferase
MLRTWGAGDGPRRGGCAVAADWTQRLDGELQAMRAEGTYKRLRALTSATGPTATLEGYGEVVVLCSNDYLGLAAHPAVVRGGVDAMERYGAGTASVRFISGTMAIHRELEERLAAWVGTEAAVTFVSCWNANEGLIPTLVGEGDAVFSDALNHASIIDACRLSRAERVVYRHSDLEDLEAKLAARRGARTRLIVTDGVFSMEGDLARLPEILDLAERYDAVVAVDDSHGIGVLGRTGRGTAEHFGVLGRVPVITGTLGKALGGAAGGFVAASRSVIDYLTQRSRPQLFSNGLPPAVAGSALAALDVLAREPERVARLHANARTLRRGLRAQGWRPLDGESAIVPVIVGATADAIIRSEQLLTRGILVVGFGFPVVPEGAARLRVQASAAHTPEQLQRALAAFGQLASAGTAAGPPA